VNSQIAAFAPETVVEIRGPVIRQVTRGRRSAFDDLVFKGGKRG
jgi:hypothetical protein